MSEVDRARRARERGDGRTWRERALAAEAALAEKDTEAADWYAKALAAQQDCETAVLALADMRRALEDACDVAIWMSGSSDFSPEGVAHEGWAGSGGMREKLNRARRHFIIAERERSLAGMRRALEQVEDAALKAAQLLPMTLSTSVEADHRDDHPARAGWLLRHKVLPVARRALAAAGPAPTKDERCECGHPASLHFMESAQPACTATVYTDAPLGGGHAYPCPCRAFVAGGPAPEETT